MSRFFLLVYIFCSLSFMMLPTALAVDVHVATSCHMPAEGGRVSGENIYERIPTASVSKVFTSEWAISQRKMTYRYPTFVDIFKTKDPNIWDVHLRGSFDPFFDREQLHFLISELNKMGITHVGQFSFDEKFKFTWDAKGSKDADGNKSIAVIELPLGAPTADTISSNLKKYSPFLRSYNRTRANAAAAKVNLVASPKFKVDKIAYVPSTMFCKTNSLKADKMRILYSAPLSDLLREMNRTSNNYAADQIFASLGGAKAYKAYANKEFGFKEKDIHISNGSGVPLFTDLDGNQTEKYYNEATCSAVLTVLKSLRDKVSKHKNGLASVMVVAGLDQNSTLKTYSNEMTENSLVGKTGTINANVALGGLVLSQKGRYLFYENINTGWSAGWTDGRNLIRQRVVNLIKDYGGPAGESFEVEKFFAYGPEFKETGHSCGYSYVFTPAPGPAAAKKPVASTVKPTAKKKS